MPSEINDNVRPFPGEPALDEALGTREILDFLGDAVLRTDVAGRIVYMNRMAETLTGYSCEEATGRPVVEILYVIDADTRRGRPDPTEIAIETNRVLTVHLNALLVTRNGREVEIQQTTAPLHDANDQVIGAMIIFHETRYSAEHTARMARLARHDPLTGLLNRYAFDERFEQTRALARRARKKMALLFIDLDNFKEINDTLGHTRGDMILRTLAGNFLSCIRETDCACRYGGDEFIIILGDIEQADDVAIVAEKIRASTAELMVPGGHSPALHVSIGSSIFPDDGDALHALIEHADIAMYEDKNARKSKALDSRKSADSYPRVVSDIRKERPSNGAAY